MALPFLTEKGLQQASAEVVARYRAACVGQRAQGALVLDATCGIGADSCALGLAGLRVVSADRDAENVELTRANRLHHGLDGAVVQADATARAVEASLVLIDPDRRAGAGRSLDPARWSPTLGAALAAATRADGACLKLAPALAPEVLVEAESSHLPAGTPRRREWISRRGELAELCLWTGALAGENPEERQATRLDGDGGVHALAGRPEPVEAWGPEQAARVAWIADPDPALLRAGLLGNLARRLGLAPLAPRIAYLGGEVRPETPFLRSWRVLGSAPLDPRRVRRLLAEHDVGPLEVHKRGHPDPPEVLARRFRGKGGRRGRLLVARLERSHRAYLVESAPESRLVGDEGLEPPTPSL